MLSVIHPPWGSFRATHRVPAVRTGSQVLPEDVPAPRCSRPAAGFPPPPLAPPSPLTRSWGSGTEPLRSCCCSVRGGAHASVVFCLGHLIASLLFSPERVSSQCSQSLKFHLCQLPWLVKPQDQRLGSFVVWFNVTAPLGAKKATWGRPACQQLQGRPACVPRRPSGLGPCPEPRGGGGGSGLPLHT